MKSYLILGVRVLLGLIFVVSGVSKFTDLNSFVGTIKGFGLVPDSMDRMVAFLIPSLEFISGLALVFGLFTRISSAVVTGLLILFIAAIIPNIAEGNEIDCGCFGPLMQSKVGIGLLIRDIIMLVFATMIFSEKTYKLSLHNLINKD